MNIRSVLKLFAVLAISLSMTNIAGITKPAVAAPVQSSLTSTSYFFDEQATYTIKFWVPKGLKVGYVGVSFQNPYVDLSNASLSVSGLAGGTPKVEYQRGISGNHDLQYRLGSVATIANDAWITLTVHNAKNPSGPNGSIGWDYIAVYDSTTVNRDAFYAYNAEFPGNSYSNPTNKYIYLKSNATPTPTATQKPTPLPTKNPAITPVPTRKPVTTITPNTPSSSLSLSTITLWSYFYFEGSRTTDISKISDPKNVENFTLDTREWTIVFAESLDLTDQKTLAAFDSFEEYWEIEWWFIWIHIEWWEIIDVPVEVTYKNAETTAYAPKVVAKEPDTSDIAKVTESKPGESKITVSGPGRVEIVPNVVFEGDNNVTSTNNNYTFNVSTSHKNLEYIVKINGTEVELKPENADWEKGTFQFTARNLNNSKNDVELLYKQKDAKEFISAGKKTVTIEEEKGWINASGTVSLSMLVLLFLLGVITSGVLLVGGFLVYRYNLIGKLLQRIRKA